MMMFGNGKGQTGGMAENGEAHTMGDERQLEIIDNGEYQLNDDVWQWERTDRGNHKQWKLNNEGWKSIENYIQ